MTETRPDRSASTLEGELGKLLSRLLRALLVGADGPGVLMEQRADARDGRGVRLGLLVAAPRQPMMLGIRR